MTDNSYTMTDNSYTSPVINQSHYPLEVTLHPVIKPLEWKEYHWDGNDDYNAFDEVTADTPFGSFRITWRDWKEQPVYVIEETPWSTDPEREALDTLDGAKSKTEEEYQRRILQCLM